MSRPKSCRTRRPKYLSSIPAEIVHLEPRTMFSSGAVGAFIGQGMVTVLGVQVPAAGLELTNTITSGQLGNTTAVDSNGHTVIVGYGNDATNTPRFGHFNPAGSTYEDVISVAAGHFWVSYNQGGGVFQAPVDFGALPSGVTLTGLRIDYS